MAFDAFFQSQILFSSTKALLTGDRKRGPCVQLSFFLRCYFRRPSTRSSLAPEGWEMSFQEVDQSICHDEGKLPVHSPHTHSFLFSFAEPCLSLSGNSQTKGADSDLSSSPQEEMSEIQKTHIIGNPTCPYTVRYIMWSIPGPILPHVKKSCF